MNYNCNQRRRTEIVLFTVQLKDLMRTLSEATEALTAKIEAKVSISWPHYTDYLLRAKGKELVYLACVLCFIFVNEIHHKESETQTLEKHPLTLSHIQDTPMVPDGKHNVTPTTTG